MRDSTDIANAIEQVNGIVAAQNVALQSVKTALEGKAAGGGSGSTTYKLLCEQTLTEAVNSVSWTTDKGGNAFDFTNTRELILLILRPEAATSSNMYFVFGGANNGFAFTNGATFKYAVVKHTIYQSQNAIYKEATMLSGTTSYMWQTEGIVQRTAWMATSVTEADLKPAKLKLSDWGTATFAVGTKIAVLVR